MAAIIHVRKWRGKTPPGRILVMRFHALGDTLITLPYLRSIKSQYPHIKMDLLTRDAVSAVPRASGIFRSVMTYRGGFSVAVQLLLVLLKVPYLLSRRYDAVLDLQNNKISRIVRTLVFARSWTAFDTSSPLSAGERTRRTIEALWHWNVSFLHNPEKISMSLAARELLDSSGRKGGNELVVLNPAGYCSSRNWPLENYVEFAKGWQQHVNPHTQFVLLLLPRHRKAADYIARSLGNSCIDLTGRANQVEAFHIVASASLVLTEDSGLMHMSWTQKIPTIALFSSSRKDWSAPLGEWSICLDSADLPCGPCMREECLYHDNRCLTRYSPERLLLEATKLRSTIQLT